MSCGALTPEWEHWRRKRRAEFCRAGTRPDLADHLDAQATGPSCLPSAMLSETPQEVVDQSGISDAIGHTLTILNSAEVRIIKAPTRIIPAPWKSNGDRTLLVSTTDRPAGETIYL
jgi:hypothetical protein